MTQRIAIAFVDGTDFYTSGEECKEKMQQIMDQHTKLYKTTGVKIQQDKINLFCWK